MTSLNKELLLDLSKNQNTIIITPNQRLAATLIDEHSSYQVDNTWLKANIISIQHWGNHLWQDYIFELPKKILTTQEENIIWQEVVKNSETGSNILNPVKTAELAKQAWHNLIQWNYQLSNLEKYINSSNLINTQVFCYWAKKFQTHCDLNHYIDHASAIRHIANNQSFLKNLAQNSFVFYEFLELTPLQQLLIKNIAQYKTVKVINHHKKNSSTHSIKRVELDTQEQELGSMAQWAHELHINNRKLEKKLKIACVIPSLHQIKNDAERVFKKIFNSNTPPIDFSAGTKLSDYPVIQLATNILEIATGSAIKPHDFELFSTIIKSPYLRHAEREYSQRMFIDKQLRTMCNRQLSLKSYMHHLKSISSKFNLDTSFAKLVEQLNNFQINLSSLSKLEFTKHSIALLLTIGWPGERSLDSTEYQVTQRFIKLLDELQSLICFAKPASYQHCLLLLNQLANNTVFQIEKEKTDIQILGLLEASGMQFDHLWLMGLDDLTWPSKAKPNPFLPHQLQSTSKMPHASAEREFDFCETLTNQLINNSKQVIISSAKTADDKILRPSGLINHIKLSEHSECVNSYSNQAHSSTSVNTDRLETISDQTGTAITKNSLEEIKGGTEIIRRQSLCPFMAYASLRLNADGLKPLTDAPDALLRGSLLHKTLELFWLSIQNQANLLSLSATELEDKINFAVDQAISEINKNYFSELMLEIEKTRLVKLINQTLNLEIQRENFKIVGLEQKQKFSFEHFNIHIKADRIDQLDNGEYVIIDYKTGLPSMSSWFGERPKEPQLPLYCVIQSKTAHLVFAQVRFNNCVYKGISQNAENFSLKIKTIKNFDKTSYDYQANNWSAQQERWKMTIEKLASDFTLGKAAVDPVDYTACNFCDLHSLCRINEKNNKNLTSGLANE